jgi:hypothetical protein
MAAVIEKIQLNEVLRFRDAICSIVYDNPDTLIIQTTAGFIPKTQFQEIFISTGHVVVNKGIKKIILDNRSGRIFHQPQLEWYFLVWLELMFYHGLHYHAMLLPLDEDFRKDFRDTLRKLQSHHPEAKFNQLKLETAESLKEAIESIY